ncbi:MAG: hypothetical protein ACI4V7_05275 [Succinivibrionaceae bacterium]
MATIQNKVIHRFIRSIDEYEEGGLYYNRVIPLDTQAYAYYPVENPDSTSFASASDSTSIYKTGLYYVLGDGDHTYTEIRDGKGNVPSAKEYPVFTQNLFDDKIDTLIAGSNVVISGEGSFRKISVPGVAVPDRFTSDQELPEELFIGDELQNLDGTRAFAIKPPASLKENDIIYFANQFQLLVTYVDPSETLYDAVVIYAPAPEKELTFENIKGNPEDNLALSVALDDKLEKKNLPNTIYGVDENGNQTLYHFLDVGIPDAPKDNNKYIRENGEWVKIDSLAVINDTSISSSTTYSSKKIENKFKELLNSIHDLSVLNIEIVDELPKEGIAKTLYLVSNHKTESKNIYDEYLWLNDNWEIIGNTDIDLSEYATKSELENVVATKQNTLIPGKNIKIENNVISALSEVTSINKKLPDDKGNITLDKNDIGLGSVDNTADLDKPISKATLYVLDELQNDISQKQDKLYAGRNIIIENNVISATEHINSYNALVEKPTINGIELVGDKTFEELGIQASGDFATNEKVDNIEKTLTETKADKAYDLEGYGILNAYTKSEVNEKFANKVNTESGLSKVQYDISIINESKANKATTLYGYGITDAYTKLWIDTNFVSIVRHEYDINTLTSSLNTLDTTKASKDELSSSLLKKQNVLTAGNHVDITNDVISTNYLYEDLTDKPTINSVELAGNKTLEELGIQPKGNYATSNDLKLVDLKVDTKQNILTAGEGIILKDNVISVVNNIDSYNDLVDKPQINGIELKGNVSLDTLNIQEKGDFATVDQLLEETNRAIKAEGLLNSLLSNVSSNVSNLNRNVTGIKKEIKEKQDTLIAGYGIRLDGNVISVDLGDKPEESGFPEESGTESSGETGWESGYCPILPTEDYVTREEYEAKCNEYENKISALTKRLDRIIDIVTDQGFLIVGVDDAVDF